MIPQKVDITMTAVIRPAMLARTLKTITRFVVRKQKGFRLIINVDPIGEDIDQMKVVKTAKKFFDEVKYNIAKEPSFSKAVKWIWSQAEAPFIFHWEDDIMISREIDVVNMISILNKYPKLSSLRLYKANTPAKKSFSVFSCKWILKPEGFYIANDWKRQFGLNPILIKKAFIVEAVKRMKDDVNPEKQFRFSQPYMRDHIQNWEYGLYTKPGEKRIVDGRQGEQWKIKLGLKKPRGTTFLKWEQNVKR